MGCLRAQTEIDIADCFAPPAQASGDFGQLDFGQPFEGFEQRLADLHRFDDPHAAGGLGSQLDSLLDGLDLFIADAFEAVELALVDRLGQFLQRGDLSLFPEQRDGLGAEAGNLEHRNQSGGDAGGDFVEILAFAGGDKLFDDPLAGWADAFEVFQLALAVVFLEIDGHVLQNPRDLGESDGLEGAFALDVHQGGEGAEKIGEVGVEGHGGEDNREIRNPKLRMTNQIRNPKFERVFIWSFEFRT